MANSDKIQLAKTENESSLIIYLCNPKLKESRHSSASGWRGNGRRGGGEGAGGINGGLSAGRSPVCLFSA